MTLIASVQYCILIGISVRLLKLYNPRLPAELCAYNSEKSSPPETTVKWDNKIK